MKKPSSKQLASLREGNESGAGRKAREAVSHTVRTQDGGTRTFARYTRKLAIEAHCMECMGWEEDPAGCASNHCPLFPFRRKTLATRRSDKEGRPTP